MSGIPLQLAGLLVAPQRTETTLFGTFDSPAESTSTQPPLGLDEEYAFLAQMLSMPEFNPFTGEVHEPQPTPQPIKRHPTDDLYQHVTEPFNYSHGFHYLLNYVKKNMTKQDMMRVCRSLADIRPLLISRIMHLTRQDLLLMEKCFQRMVVARAMSSLDACRNTTSSSCTKQHQQSCGAVQVRLYALAASSLY
jgi:hypothetical protein